MFWRTRHITESDIRKIIRAVAPESEDVVIKEASEVTDFRDTCWEIQDSICAAHESVARYFMEEQTTFSSAFIEGFNKTVKSKRRRACINVEVMEEVLKMGIEDYKALWSSIAGAVHPDHWSIGGKFGDDCYQNLRRASHILINQWCRHMANDFTSISRSAIQRDLSNATDFANPAFWPNLPRKESLPKQPATWELVMIDVTAPETNPGYQAMFKRWGSGAVEYLDRRRVARADAVDNGTAEEVPDNGSDIANSDDEIPLGPNQSIGISDSEYSDAEQDMDLSATMTKYLTETGEDVFVRPQRKDSFGGQPVASSVYAEPQTPVSNTSAATLVTPEDGGGVGLHDDLKRLFGSRECDYPPPVTASPEPPTPHVDKLLRSDALFLQHGAHNPTQAISDEQLADIKEVDTLALTNRQRAAMFVLGSEGSTPEYRNYQSDQVATMGTLGLNAYSIAMARKRQVELSAAMRILRQEEQWLTHAMKHEVAMRERLVEDELVTEVIRDEVRNRKKEFVNARQATIAEATSRSAPIPASLARGEKHMQATGPGDSAMPFNGNMAQQFMNMLQQITSNMQGGSSSRVNRSEEQTEGPPTKKFKGSNDGRRTEEEYGQGNDYSSSQDVHSDYLDSQLQVEPGRSEAQLVEKHTMGRLTRG